MPGYETKPYPFPGDSREERAKRVAHSYRQLVQDIAQGRCDDPAGALHRIDMQWRDVGVYWPCPMPDIYDDDEWLPAPDLAHYFHRTRKDIYNWARHGNITQRTGPDGRPEYSVRSVREYLRSARARRAGSSKT
jgi:hypothetical protein